MNDLTTKLCSPKIQNELLSFCRHLSGNDHAEDLRQQVLLSACRNLEKYQEQGQFLAWLKVIAKNTYINHYRKKKRQTTFSAGDFMDCVGFDSRPVTNDGEFVNEREQIWGEFEALATIYRTPLEMWMNGMKYDEIATKLQAPLGTIKSRIFFARKKLGDKLRGLGILD